MAISFMDVDMFVNGLFDVDASFQGTMMLKIELMVENSALSYCLCAKIESRVFKPTRAVERERE